MKILVATALTQGARSNDYCYCVSGEPVWVQDPCDRDRRDPNDECGCSRGFAGAASHRATTTAQVADLPLTRAELIDAMRMSLDDGGWPVEWAEDVVDDNLIIASVFSVGTVIERSFDQFRPRAA
ncbi:DUF7715 family protein [Mycolicibacterium fallax]|uniref:DUF7715 domain-containing protein n=1 Tax=Mycolicibacterium fallax TaxID=1793 RepID=A0A1X1R809_MYCFA|nr:hypothetical protein [Mycolicibacterium fallax]ORV01097.1 hypothetical protein AWC04_13990 [Mycolicibacterium fallax]BBY98319.1 hypothetical protein MFAL_17860 [Mycolicibacterium fallax]